MEKNQPLTREDLILLMESYRNMITMHQTILDQTSKTIERMDNIATKQDSLFSKQGQIYSSLQVITNDLKNTTSHTSTCNEKIENLTNDFDNYEKKSIENHGKIINKIYVGWIGMGLIVIGLIGLITKTVM